MIKASELAQELRSEIDRSITVLNRIAAQIDALDGDQSVLVQVPYRSQHDGDARISRMDCGPACVAMLLEWRGTRVSIDDITRATSMGATNAGQLIAVASKHGLTMQRIPQMSLDDIDEQVKAGKPMIALVNYPDFGDQRQDTAYNGLHWVVVVGVDAGNIYINDPDYWGERRNEGKCKPISRAVFDRAWFNTMPDAISRQALVVT